MTFTCNHTVDLLTKVDTTAPDAYGIWVQLNNKNFTSHIN